MIPVSRDRKLVRHKAQKAFPDENQCNILAILDAFADYKTDDQRNRVQLAIPGLARDTNVHALAVLVEKADTDYRDILA